jgi:hypothetical protein
MLGPRLHDQPPVNADKATGQRKRVYRIVAHDKKSIIPYPVIDPRQQAEPEIVDVAIQQRIERPSRFSRSIFSSEFCPSEGSSELALAAKPACNNITLRITARTERPRLNELQGYCGM